MLESLMVQESEVAKNVCHQPDEVISFARYYLDIHSKAMDCCTDLKAPSLVSKWQNPREDVIKINYDAAIFQADGDLRAINALAHSLARCALGKDEGTTILPYPNCDITLADSPT
ncbi:UNVERIFIED_CONTAM: hypothetical protein Sindi_2814100 [Sesamum indicum]